MQYYYEPGTGQKFRSRIAAQRYLAEMREDVPLSATLEELKENKPLSKMFKLHHQTKVANILKVKISLTLCFFLCQDMPPFVPL